MGTISAPVSDAFHLLCADLFDHLDEAEALASEEKRWYREDVEAARRLIPDLVLVIRGLLLRPSGDAWWRLPDLYLGVALPGGDGDPRVSQGPGPGVRRDHHPGE